MATLMATGGRKTTPDEAGPGDDAGGEAGYGLLFRES